MITPRTVEKDGLFVATHFLKALLYLGRNLTVKKSWIDGLVKRNIELCVLDSADILLKYSKKIGREIPSEPQTLFD